MPEQEPPSSREFDDQAVAEALDTRSATVRDVAYGEGVQYSVGRGDARLEVYPRTGVTRLTARDVRIELFGSAVTDVSPGGVEFSRTQPGQDVSLTVVPGGGIVFTLVAGGERTRTVATEPDELLPAPPPLPSAPDRAAETAQEPRSDPADPSVPPPAVRALDALQATREPSSPPAPGE